jgi:hypothetical protein
VHLAQLTFGVLQPGFNAADPYGNTVALLRSWPATLMYVAFGVAVGIHLLPGTWTGMRSLGLITRRTAWVARTLAPAVAALAAAGAAAVPLAAALGLLR